MKIKVGFIYGGKSVEHEISVISAVQAMNHLDTNKYDIVPIYITKDLQMVGSLITSLTISKSSDHDLLHTILLIFKWLVPFSVSINNGLGNWDARVDFPMPSHPMITVFIGRF